uniref:Intu_longin_1 domain-containing protein n=1 Tax=Mesocestoides corti TaxID=53468 RepID=A0A5K3EK88_MESCO
MAFPLTVKEFFVFTTRHAKNLGHEAEQVLYFYPHGKSQNDQLSVVGLCEALLSFSNFFSTSCTSIHTRNGKHFFHQLIDQVWAVMNVSVVDSAAIPHCHEFCEHVIDDSLMGHRLSATCERYKLLHGPISISTDTDLEKNRKNLAAFFNKV